MANISEHVEMPLMRGIKTIMFCAHDNREHTVCYSSVASGWIVENVAGLVSCHESMTVALDVMRMCARTIPSQWTVTDNPYNI